MSDDDALAGTMPFPTRCTAMRRCYARLKTCFTCWHPSVFPGRDATSSAFAETFVLESDVIALASTFPHTLHSGKECRTDTPPDIEALVHGLDVTVKRYETHGGMGRIYALEDPRRVLKIADVRTSWCKYEPRNYEIMDRLAIPCAAVYVSAMRRSETTAYVVLVLERLDFTMTAFLRACGRMGVRPGYVAGMLDGLMRSLEVAGVVFGDLSPDNIMFRHVGGNMYELALVDPQFLVTHEEFQGALGLRRADAFDRTYLALKIRAVGILDPPVRKFADGLCELVLGAAIPSERETRRWLSRDAPVVLFRAYDILRHKFNQST